MRPPSPFSLHPLVPLPKFAWDKPAASCRRPRAARIPLTALLTRSFGCRRDIMCGKLGFKHLGSPGLLPSAVDAAGWLFCLLIHQSSCPPAIPHATAMTPRPWLLSESSSSVGQPFSAFFTPRKSRQVRILRLSPKNLEPLRNHHYDWRCRSAIVQLRQRQLRSGVVVGEGKFSAAGPIAIRHKIQLSATRHLWAPTDTVTCAVQTPKKAPVRSLEVETVGEPPLSPLSQVAGLMLTRYVVPTRQFRLP